MSWRINIVLLFITFSACQTDQQQAETSETLSPSTYLIEAKEAKSLSKHISIKFLDFRSSDQYQKGHIPGALHVKRSDLEDSSYAYKGMMASPKQLETLFSSLGINSTDTLIIYDDNGLCEAARLWWVLQNYDFINVRLMHGGLNDWQAGGGKLTTDTNEFETTEFKLPATYSMKYHISNKDLIASKNIILLDTRSIEEYEGTLQKKGAARAGRIPKSMHIDWTETIHYLGNKKLKSIEELEMIYARLIPSKTTPIVVYCHSGVRSAHTTFVLTQLLGYSNVRNYDGSWVEWSQFEELEIEKDSITRINI